jgi:hypothetical protein
MMEGRRGRALASVAMQIGSTFVLGVLAAFALSTVPACDDKAADDKKAADAKAKADAKPADDAKAKAEPAKTDAPAKADGEAKADAPAEGGGGGGDKIGVEVCDDYIAKYSKCIEEKVPEAARQQMRDAVQQSIKVWKQAADGPAKDGLPTACNAALDAAKQATSTMGCTW